MQLFSKKKTALAAALMLAIAQGVFAAPQAPTGLQAPAMAVSETDIPLIWERPKAGDKVIGYNVYMDGKLIVRTDQDFSTDAKKELKDFYQKSPNAVKILNHMYRVKGLKEGSTHTFTVRALDNSGNESPDSNSIKVTTRKKGKVVDITQFGAVGDGSTINTSAIQQAVNKCPVGGVVVVPPGVYKTGMIWLHGDMTLEIQKGATILATETPDAYQYGYHLYPYISQDRFYALFSTKYKEGDPKMKNLRIVGEGTIDGNGWKKGPDGNYLYREKAKKGAKTLPKNHVSNIGILAWNQVDWLDKNKGLNEDKAYQRRSSMMLLQGVDNVAVSGITFRNPANHTLILSHCNDVTVENTKFMTYNCNNGDGIEFAHGAGLKVYDSIFDTGDDCINFAAGQGAEGEKDKPTEKIWVFNNSIHHGHGTVVMGSHTAAFIQNLLAEDNVVDGCEVGLRMKSNAANGGGARNITFRYNALRNIEKNFVIATTGYSDPNQKTEFPKATKPAYFYDVVVENCTVEKTGKAAIEIVGAPNAKHFNFLFKDIVISGGKPWIITDAEKLTFENVKQTDLKTNNF